MSRLFLMILLMASLAPTASAQDSSHRRDTTDRRHVEAERPNRCSEAQIRSHHCRSRRASPSHQVAQAAIMAPAPRVADMSGYRTTVYVAPSGTPYPLTEPKPGDYLCTTDPVPLGTKVPGMHSPKPHPPCGYKWRYDSGKDKGYWWLAPDPNYGVRP